MKHWIVCPYYGKAAGGCETGCGYISPSDVNVIIVHCSSAYQSCRKYQQLAEQAATVPGTETGFIPSPYTEAQNNSTRSEMSHTPDSGQSTSDPSRHPALSLMGFGAISIMLGILWSGLLRFDPAFLAFVFFCGGATQSCAALLEFRKNPTGGTVFLALGLFWLSMIPLYAFPTEGFGPIPTTTTLSAYLSMWGLFCLIFFTGTAHIERSARLTLGAITLFFALWVTKDVTASPSMAKLAGYQGVACGLTLWYLGLRQTLRDIGTRTLTTAAK